MSKTGFNSDDYYERSSSFAKYRDQIKPVERQQFGDLLGQVTRVVLSEPTYYYRSRRPNEAGTTTVPRNMEDYCTGIEVIEEIDGPMRTADNRAMDIRLFTREHSMRQSLGFLAYVGTDWKPTSHIEDLVDMGDLAKGLLNGGVAIKADIGTIDTLWVLSSDNRNNWITSYDEGRPITPFEYEQLATDLATYPSV